MLTRQPPIEVLVARAGSRYAAVVLAARRAEQLAAGALPLVDTRARSPITVALEELAAGRVGPAPGPDAAHVRSDAVGPSGSGGALSDAEDVLSVRVGAVRRATMPEAADADDGPADRSLQA